MATLNSHGLEPQEEAIMDAWDAGKSVDQIAAELDLNFGRVRTVIYNFSEKRVDRWRLRVPSATEELLAAIARAHPERVAV